MDPQTCMNASQGLCDWRTLSFFAHGAGEVLGCTAPVIAQSADAIVFVADGRFHLEAIMIANPDIPAFRCDTSFFFFIIVVTTLTISLSSIFGLLVLFLLLLLLLPLDFPPSYSSASLVVHCQSRQCRWCVLLTWQSYIQGPFLQLSQAQILSHHCVLNSHAYGILQDL